MDTRRMQELAGIPPTNVQEDENTGIDLFQDYENIPAEVQKILNTHADAFEYGDYRDLEKVDKELSKIGYTFDYGLDGQAYDLRPIGTKGKADF